MPRLPMPRLFVALPVPEEVADELIALQSGVPDARWQPPENFHVTLCFAGEVHGATMRDLEEELSDIAGPPFPVAIAGVEQFSSGKQPKALVALVDKSDRLDWLQQKVSAVARNCGIEVERRKFRPHVTLARFGNGAETGHHIAQFMASHSTFRSGPWIAQHFALYSSRSGGSGRIYTEEAAYDLAF
jgi:RNA 2',3'-cyclic 3'-phosphodiesterase